MINVFKELIVELDFISISLRLRNTLYDTADSSAKLN